MPVSALAGQSGYHHQDWPDQYCLQAYDVTLSAKEVYELRIQNKLESEILERSKASAREWGTWGDVEGGFQLVELGVLGTQQPVGEHPIILYVNADDRETGYIEITAYVTEPEPMPEPTPEPFPQPTPTPTVEPTPEPSAGPTPTLAAEPAPSAETKEPILEVTDEAGWAAEESGKPIASQVPGPTDSDTGEPELMPELPQTAEPEPTLEPANSMGEGHVKTSVPQEKTEAEERKDELTPLAVTLFSASAGVGVLFALSILKDLGSIRWYKKKLKK